MRHGFVIATREHGRGFRRTSLVLESHPYSRTGSAGGASANGVDHHEDGTVARLKKAVDIGRGPGFFDAVLRKICPHRGDKVFWVCHGLILTAAGLVFIGDLDRS